jgi:hypothetical protein
VSDAWLLDRPLIDKKLMSQFQAFGYEMAGDEEL